MKAVVHLHKFLHSVLLQNDHAACGASGAPSAGLTVHQVSVLTPALTGDEQDVKNFHVTLIAVVGWFIFDSSLICDLLPAADETVSLDLTPLHGL